MNRIAITEIEYNNHLFLAFVILDENRNVIDFQIFSSEIQSVLNHIYIGRVENIVNNIHAAFIRISDTQRCFLSLNDLKSPIFTKKLSQKKEICIGDELIVQVTRDPVKTKEPVVSTKLTLSGKYALLTTENTNISISKKLKEEEKKRLRTLLSNNFQFDPQRSYGIVVRTNAVYATDSEFIDDVSSLIQNYNDMIETSVHKTVYSKIYQEQPGYITRIKGIDFQSFDFIYSNIPDVVDNISNSIPALKDQIRLYQDKKLSLSSLYNISGTLEHLLSRYIWLKSGANIIIESLETLTVIDVNTGKNLSNKEDIILSVNKEAAVEIAKQLRLRNISGMIIIDFINMKSKNANQELIELLKEEIAKDCVKCNFIDITKLGLVELTRQKQYRSLRETINVSGNQKEK